MVISKFYMKKGRPHKKIPDKNIINRKYLWDLYYNKNNTQLDIAKITGVAKWTIQKLFKEYNIPPRKVRNKNVTFENEKKLNDISWLKHEHCVKKRSMIDISKELGVADVNVAAKFKKFNIQKNQSFGNYVWNIFKDDSDAKDQLTQLNEKITLTEISEKFNVSVGCVSLWFKKYNITPKIHGISKEQKQMFEFISKHVDCNLNDRIVLNGKELDIFIPSKDIAIEMNGLYFHTSAFINSNYHADKTIKCEEKGIRLFHFYDKEWNEKTEIVKSIILNAISFNEKIMARKTKIVSVKQNEANDFYDSNHLQGRTNSKINIGLEYGGKLVSCMSFTPSRFNKKYEWELSRFSSIINTNVVGGASKLLNHFIKQYDPNNIISYADKRISQGKLYHKLGFDVLNEVKPNYYYLIDKELVRKEKFRHKNLHLLLDVYDPNLSEKENTENNNIFRIYDCGKICFLWSKK
jgi:transposase